MKKILAFLLLPALFCASVALAQVNPPVPPPFAALGAQTSIAATSSSSSVQLPASTVAFGAITIQNTSATVDAYVALGGSTIVALNSGGTCLAPTFTQCLVPAGQTITIWAAGNTYVAGITASSSTTLLIYQGTGPVFAKGKGGGGGGTVNTGTAPDVAYYATTTNAVSDGGSAVVTAGGINLAASTVPANGLYLSSTNTLGIATNSGNRWTISPVGNIIAASGNGPEILNNNTSGTVPVLVPLKADVTTGIGSSGAGTISFVAGGANAAELSATGITYPSTATNGITLCGTVDCTTNFEKGQLFWNGSTLTLQTIKGGSGNIRAITITPSGSNLSETINASAVANGGVNFAVGNSVAGAAGVGITGTFNASSGVQSALSLLGTISQSTTGGFNYFTIQPTVSGTGSGVQNNIFAGTAGNPGTFTVTTAGAVNSASSITGKQVSSVPSAVVTVATDLNQKSGGTTALAFASTASIAVGQVVSGTSIAAGIQVASIVSTAQVTKTANGVSNSDQKVLTTTNTTSTAVGQQCVDVTTPAALGDGNLIASIQAGVSITMVDNLTGATVNGDSIKCDPVVTLGYASSATINAAASLSFFANNTTATSSAAQYSQADETILGNLNLGLGSSIRMNGQMLINTGISSTTTAQVPNSIAVGYSAGNAGAIGANNVIMGGGTAAARITNAFDNVVIGGGSVGQTITGSGDSNNVIIGYNSRAGSAGSPSGNDIVIGASALSTSTYAGHDNTVIGNGVASTITTGNNNIVIGSGATPGITTGSANVVIGKITGLATGLANAIVLGDGAGNIRADYGSTTAATWTLAGGLVLPGIAASSAGSKALCVNGTTVTVSATNACPS